MTERVKCMHVYMYVHVYMHVLFDRMKMEYEGNYISQQLGKLATVQYMCTYRALVSVSMTLLSCVECWS